MSTSAAPEHTLETYLAPAFKRKAASITAIDVRELTSYTDTIVIIEGTSRRQVSSMAEYIVQALKTKKINVLGKEGIKEGEWALLDYGDVIIHVFEPDAKSFFNLEGLWADAPQIDLSQFKQRHGFQEDDNE
jgi:ribosome-associated protein